MWPLWRLRESTHLAYGRLNHIDVFGLNKKSRFRPGFFIWSGMPDLNRRPHGPQPCALPTAPIPVNLFANKFTRQVSPSGTIGSMKTLKLNHEGAQLVRTGRKHVTWRINDDKNLSVNDHVQLIDQVNPKDAQSWLVIGEAIINEIIMKRLGDITKSDMAGSEQYPTPEDMYAQYQKYYGDDVGPKTPVKIIHFDFVAYPNLRPFKAVKATTHEEIKLYADGGSRGNPGPSAAGYVLLDMADNVIKKEGIYLGLTTNNQAEYQAVRLGLEAAKAAQARTINVYLDSLLVVNQMKGIFKVKNRDLIPVYNDMQELVRQFKQVTFRHVPRELNKLADEMVNEALDKVAASG